ncbi:MAG: hypothetical protein AB7P99_04790 [Vicinamibacterales bacterium]
MPDAFDLETLLLNARRGRRQKPGPIVFRGRMDDALDTPMVSIPLDDFEALVRLVEAKAGPEPAVNAALDRAAEALYSALDANASLRARLEQMTASRDRAQEANSRLKREADDARALAERLKVEAQAHAQEARTANATIAEIYQAVTGATGEPGNWNGARPVVEALRRLRVSERLAAYERAQALVGEAALQRLAGEPVFLEPVLVALDNAVRDLKIALHEVPAPTESRAGFAAIPTPFLQPLARREARTVRQTPEGGVIERLVSPGAVLP